MTNPYLQFSLSLLCQLTVMSQLFSELQNLPLHLLSFSLPLCLQHFDFCFLLLCFLFSRVQSLL